jgi:hypothetical protein
MLQVLFSELNGNQNRHTDNTVVHEGLLFFCVIAYARYDVGSKMFQTKYNQKLMYYVTRRDEHHTDRLTD